MRNGELKQKVWWGEWAMIALLVLAGLTWAGRAFNIHPIDNLKARIVNSIPTPHLPVNPLPTYPFPTR